MAQTTRSLEGLVQLRFRVVDQGRPLPAAPVDLRHRTGAYGGRRIAGSRSDDEGAVQFLVPRDVADSLAVLVSAPGRTLLAQTVDLELPEQVLDLPAAGRLIVMVRGGSQVDLEYRTYQLHDRESGLFLAAEAVDSKDRLVFDRLPVGRPLALFQGSEFSSGVPLRDDLVVPADRKVLEWNDAPPPVIPR